jgi:hypothetical protein
MARYKWHADYFDHPTSLRCVRRATVEADNAGEAEKIAKAGMGFCKRLEVRRVATTAPVRIVYARDEPRTKSLSAAEIIALTTGGPTPVAG